MYVTGASAVNRGIAMRSVSRGFPYSKDSAKPKASFRGLSGFRQELVGFHVGKFGLPDINQPRWINGLGAECRVCQVSAEGERSQEIKKLIWPLSGGSRRCPASGPASGARTN